MALALVLALMLLIAALAGMAKRGMAVAQNEVSSRFGDMLAKSGLKDTIRHVSLTTRTGIAIDASQQKLVLMTPEAGCSVFAFSDIVAVDACRDGRSVTRTNRGSQALGAVVGAVLLGPLGLAIGALTGSRRRVEKVRRLSLKITTNDIQNPVREVVFLQEPLGASEAAARPALAEFEQWHGRLRVVLQGRPAPVPEAARGEAQS